MKNRRRRQPRSGFTLIEVLLVLVILVVIGSIAATSLLGMQDKADRDAAKAQVGLFERAIDNYRFMIKQYPDSLQDLVEKPSDKTAADRWEQPFLNKSKIPTDPWGNEYKFSADGKHNQGRYDVWSMGPDGDDQTDDDIGNWES